MTQTPLSASIPQVVPVDGHADFDLHEATTPTLAGFRVGVALLLLFAPTVFLPFPYPFAELARLGLLTALFPSPVAAIPAVVSVAAYLQHDEYLLFNAFTATAVASVAVGFSKFVGRLSAPQVRRAVWVTTWVVWATVIVQAIQVAGPSSISEAFYPTWMGIAVPEGRGSGLVLEPSFLAGPLAFAMTLWLAGWRVDPVKGPRVSLIVAVSISIVLSKSLLCALLFVPFVFYIFVKLAHLRIAILVVLAATIPWVYERLDSAAPVAVSSGVGAMGMALNSWRTIPDEAILANWSEYLLPFQPDSRDRVAASIARLYPEEAWIENTYSLFAATASSLGLVGVLVLCSWVLLVVLLRPMQFGLRVLLLALIPMAVFSVPKVEPSLLMGIAMLATLGEGRAAKRHVVATKARGAYA